jgi:hypothetical protein
MNSFSITEPKDVSIFFNSFINELVSLADGDVVLSGTKDAQLGRLSARFCHLKSKLGKKAGNIIFLPSNCFVGDKKTEILTTYLNRVRREDSRTPSAEL